MKFSDIKAIEEFYTRKMKRTIKVSLIGDMVQVYLNKQFERYILEDDVWTKC